MEEGDRVGRQVVCSSFISSTHRAVFQSLSLCADGWLSFCCLGRFELSRAHCNSWALTLSWALFGLWTKLFCSWVTTGWYYIACQWRIVSKLCDSAKCDYNALSVPIYACIPSWNSTTWYRPSNWCITFLQHKRILLIDNVIVKISQSLHWTLCHKRHNQE